MTNLHQNSEDAHPGHSMPSHIVAVVLTTSDGTLILQHRDGNHQGAAHLRDKVGFFGGHCEGREDPIDAAIREIDEELELTLDRIHIVKLGDYQKQLSTHGDSNFVHVVHYIKPVDPKKLTVHEGKGLVLVSKENCHTFSFTPFAGHLVGYLFGSESTLEEYRVGTD
jgi:8-oxo-dGTP pyrophosphatase MutT (NUDIX family)